MNDTTHNPTVQHMVDDLLDGAPGGSEIRVRRERNVAGDEVTVVELWGETFNRSLGVVVGAQDETLKGAVHILWRNRPRKIAAQMEGQES